MKTHSTGQLTLRGRIVAGVAIFAVVIAGVVGGAELISHSSVPTAQSNGSSSATTTSPSARSPGSQLVASATVADTPVSDATVFRLPHRGCALTPTSALGPGLTNAVRSSTTPHRHPLRALGHCRVLEVGDSLGEDLGWGLVQELGSTRGLTLIEHSKSSTGLSAAWSYNWPHHLKKYLRQYSPHLVVIMFGANDEQALNVNGNSQAFGSPAWRIAYTARVRRIDRMVTKSGSYVFWVGLPIAAPPSYSQGLRALNAIYRRVAATTPGVTFQPMWRLLTTKGGQYRGGALVNGVQSALRASDGIHFTSVGELVIGTFVARQVATVFNVNIGPHAPKTIGR